ncbi:MAG: hypothetical protein U0744_02390 [Gemmataceae bacterium]
MSLGRALLIASAALVCLRSDFAMASDAADPVRFETADGVQLCGEFYASRVDAPCVLLIHEVGKLRSLKAWQATAESLHAKGLAVLRFDLRGHGESTEVEPEKFWSPQWPNRTLVRGKHLGAVSYKQFDDRYWSFLTQDLAAAKSFLDRRNDAGQCNASNLVVVAADSGAALAALWMNGEWRRYRLQPPSFFGSAPRIDEEPEGKRILAAVLIDPAGSVGTRRVDLTASLTLPGKIGRMPIALLYGSDAAAARRSDAVEKALKNGGPELPYTGAVRVENSGTSQGAQLLTLKPVRDAIVEFVQEVHRRRNREWEDRDIAGATFLQRN